jgi:predicted nucleic acid-binding protein
MSAHCSILRQSPCKHENITLSLDDVLEAGRSYAQRHQTTLNALVLKTFAVFEIVQVTPELIQEAIDCSILNELSFWDALIFAAAAAAGCSTAYSEDLNSGQTIRGVKVQNPLLKN